MGGTGRLIQALGDTHRVPRTEAQLATRLLLQRRRRERCRRATRVGLGLDVRHGRGRDLEGLRQLTCRRLVEHRCRLRQFSVVVKVAAGGHLGVGQLGDLDPKRFALLGHDRCDDIPIRGRGERLAFALAFDNQT